MGCKSMLFYNNHSLDLDENHRLPLLLPHQPISEQTEIRRQLEHHIIRVQLYIGHGNRSLRYASVLDFPYYQNWP